MIARIIHCGKIVFFRCLVLTTTDSDDRFFYICDVAK